MRHRRSLPEPSFRPSGGLSIAPRSCAYVTDIVAEAHIHEKIWPPARTLARIQRVRALLGLPPATEDVLQDPLLEVEESVVPAQ